MLDAHMDKHSPRVNTCSLTANTFCGVLLVAHPYAFGHSCRMSEASDPFDQAAQIVEAFSEGEEDPRVIELLTQIAAAIRERAFND